MWSINSLWFEVSIVSLTFAVGHILFGHFEERTPRLRKFIKFVLFLALVLGLSVWWGRQVTLIVFGSFFVPLFYVHGVYLPRKGINGWTGEPKERYYEFRKWDKNIFK
jgi:fatty acid desaturase